MTDLIRQQSSRKTINQQLQRFLRSSMDLDNQKDSNNQDMSDQNEDVAVDPVEGADVQQPETSTAQNQDVEVEDLEKGVPHQQWEAAPNEPTPSLEEPRNESANKSMNEDIAADGVPLSDKDEDVDEEDLDVENLVNNVLKEHIGEDMPELDEAEPIEEDEGPTEDDIATAQQVEAIKAMTLDQKKELLAKYDPLEFFYVGAYIDAHDTTFSFQFAQIRNVDKQNGTIYVNYDGWSDKWEVWIKARSFKVAPFRSRHQGYSGQQKVAIRNSYSFDAKELRQTRKEVQKWIQADFEGKSAHQITQYIRGKLYVYTDFLLGNDFNTEEDPILEVNEFFKDVLRLIVTWLNKLPSMTQTIAEMQEVENLFLVDPQAAIVACAPELSDTLKRIFACCQRCLKYYCFYDQNQEDPRLIAEQVIAKKEGVTENTFGTVVQDFTAADFVEERFVNDAQYAPDQARLRVNNAKDIRFGQLCNFVQYFADIGGFNALLKVLNLGMDGGEVQLPFSMMHYMFIPLKNLADVLVTEFAVKLAVSVKEIIVKRLQGTTEKDLKSIDKDQVQRVLISMRQILPLGLPQAEVDQIYETTQLQIALRFLKSEKLQKRLEGLHNINSMVERVKQAARNALIQQKLANRANKWSLESNFEMPQSKIKASEFITAPVMTQWLHDNKVLETILGENAHIEVVKRCANILKFMAKYGGESGFTEKTVDLVWKCQQGKHEEMVRTVYNITQEVIPDLHLGLIDMFYNKIQQVPSQQYDEKFLLFLKEFTKVALEKQFKVCERRHNEKEEVENGENAQSFEKFLMNKENEEIKSFGQAAEVQNYYGLPIFWSICQDDSPSKSEEITQLALASIDELLSVDFKRQIRMPFLVKCINNILSDKSVVQSIQIATSIIKTIGQDQESDSLYSYDEIEESEAVPNVAKCLQEQLNVIDALIRNVGSYHDKVKQSIKALVAKGKLIDNKPEDQVFSGRYKHAQSQQSVLDFIEFLVFQSEQKITIGVNNIMRLWELFVKQAHFQQDTTLFLNWINKQRFKKVKVPAQNQINHYYTMNKEIYPMSEEERHFLFTQILCDPSQVDAAAISPAQVKCFQKYFRDINKANGNITYNRKQLRIAKFEELTGKDALWEIAIKAVNEKARVISQELLVDCHLKLVTEEADVRDMILSQFIEKSMTCLKSDRQKGVVQLLSIFLDRYEGKKDLSGEVQQGYKYQIKPFACTVTSFMDENQPVQVQIPLNYYQSLGLFRQKIAEAFHLEVNQFKLIIKSNVIDPETDDDKLVKDISGMFNNAAIKKNKAYDPSQHPKHLISNNDQYFSEIFSMLTENQDGILEPVWDLISKLPINKELSSNLKDLTQIKAAVAKGDPAGIESAWNNLLDPKSTFKLLYCLQIINSSLLVDKEAAAQDEEVKIDNDWQADFMRLGGFEHLIKTIIGLNLPKIGSVLNLRCICMLMATLTKLIADESDPLAALTQNSRSQLVLKLIKYIDMICEFSIDEETKRGKDRSYDCIIKKIQEDKLKKTRLKMLAAGNKGDKSKDTKDEDDDESNEDKKLQKTVYEGFKEQQDVVSKLFGCMKTIFGKDFALTEAISTYPELQSMLTKGMVLSENFLLRNLLGINIADIMKFRSVQAASNRQQNDSIVNKIMSIEIFSVLQVAYQHDSRAMNFFEHLSYLLDVLSINDLVELEPKVQPLVLQLTQMIIQREIKEANTQEEDMLLRGTMMVLKGLLQKFPANKRIVGRDLNLTKYLVHECLFEIPHGSKGGQSQKCAPKCKSYNTRQAALRLLSVLCRDDLENHEHIMQYMQDFNKRPTWRTNKESDWNIKLYNDEKSSTGRVGIKNLGCICYMNSLNQQLFMIPGFRNDILSIKDPNHDKNPDEDNMFLQWQTLFAGLLLSEKMYVNPKAYCHSFKDWEGQPVNVLEQMDVEEYLAMFLDRLEASIKGTPQEKTIQYHFGGTYANEIICKTCPHKYDRSEPFLYIGVPVKNKKSFSEGMESFVSGDMLEDGNQYQCDKCDKKVDALKRTCIKKLPKYLITTLKRFEFDFDRMIRVKVNDYFEFPTELDMSPYTQEYLNKKETFEKAKEGLQEGDAEIEQEPLKFPKEYYGYDLVGIVVHTGTADSGHYYSYIKEQEIFEPTEKWYEFNDIWVRDFDKNEIPTETFGGEEITTSMWGNQTQKMTKYRNAYLLVWVRKVDEADFPDEEEISVASPQQDQKADQVVAKLGQKHLQLPPESPIYLQIQAENHKYWQNRFLFSQEFSEFVKEVTLHWNTNFSIPTMSSWRNDDQHLMPPQLLQFSKPFQVQVLSQLNDVNLQLDTLYNPDQIAWATLQVFKFCASFYVTVCQRSSNKQNLTEFVRSIKAYLNSDYQCAVWFIQEFINEKMIIENLLDNSQKEMRKILAGVIYCAMLKVYQVEKADLNKYWEDLDAGVKEPRQTVLGNFCLTLLNMFPNVRNWSANHAQFLQLLARFSTLGAETRFFLLKAKIIDKCLNYFYWDMSPYLQEFQEAPKYVCQTKEEPDMNLPTQEDKDHTSTFYLIKEKQRLNRLKSDKPKFNALIECFCNCVRSLHVEAPVTLAKGQLNTPFAHENTAFELSRNEKILFMPDSAFLQKIFASATKPRSVIALAKAYMHVNYYDQEGASKLWDLVKSGLGDYDADKLRPFLVLFQHMLEAQESPPFSMQYEKWLAEFVGFSLQQNAKYFQWMETVIDWIIKVCFRYPHVLNWFSSNPAQWSFLFEWCTKNQDPPQWTNLHSYGGSANPQIKLNKSRGSKVSSSRYDRQRNIVLHYFRQSSLNIILSPDKATNTSGEFDVDMLDLQDVKWAKNQAVDFMECKMSQKTTKMEVCQDLDEIIQLQYQVINRDGETQNDYQWEATEKNRIYPAGLLQSLWKTKEISRLTDILEKHQAQQKAAKEQAMRSNIGQGSQYVQRPQYEDMEVDAHRGGTGSDIDNQESPNNNYGIDSDDEDYSQNTGGYRGDGNQGDPWAHGGADGADNDAQDNAFDREMAESNSDEDLDN